MEAYDEQHLELGRLVGLLGCLLPLAAEAAANVNVHSCCILV